MHPRSPVPEPLRRLAALQCGVLTLEQALAHGLTPDVIRRLVDTGAWCRLARGVLLTTPPTPDWSALAWAGTLLGGDRARLGPAASAHLHGLLDPGPEPVDVLVPLGQPVRVAGPWLFRQEGPGARSPRTTGDPPRLLPAEAVLDLSATLQEGAVVDLVTRAAVRGVSATALRRALAQRQRHRHRRLLTRLLADVGEGVESPLELSYLRDVERAHDLPRGSRQRRSAELGYRSDVAYEEYALLVELDGRLNHSGTGWFRDMRRDNAFALRGYTSLRFGWHDVVDRPCATARQVEELLTARGWPGPLRCCGRCRRVVGPC